MFFKDRDFGGNMKKIFLLILILSLASLAFGASLDINAIGLHGSGGANDFVVAAGETVTCIIDYSQTDCGIDNVYANGTDQYRIMVYYYTDDPPTDANYDTGRYVDSGDIFNINDDTANHLYSFDFTMPSVTSTSMQVRLGLAGTDTGGFKSDTYSDEYMSYVARGSIAVANGTQPSGCRGYLSFDSTTDAFESADFTNPANSSYQNSTVDVTFHLDEAAKDASVQIWIDDDGTHTQSSEVDKILTLIAEDQTQDFDLDGSDLDNDSHVESVTDNTSDIGSSFTDGNSYYMAIRYQDSAGNPEAVSDWIQFTYDTSISQPTSISATDESGSNIDIDYTLPEAAGDISDTDGVGEIKIIINDTADSEVATVTLEDASISTADSHTITLDGSDFSSSTYYVAGTGAGSLTDGTAYRFIVSYKDVAGNGPSNSSYSQMTYTTDSSTQQPTMDSAVQDTGDHNFTFQFDLPEDALSNSVKIFLDTDDDHNGSEEQIQLSDIWESAGDNQSVTLSYDTVNNRFNTADGDIDALANNYSLIDGTTYYVTISYQDASGNDASTSLESVSFTADLSTNNGITLSAPTADSYQNGNFDITYTLPETGTDGTIKLLFYNDSALSDIRAELTLETGQNLNNTSSHTITLDPTSLSSASEVASYNSSYENTLIDDSDAPEDYYFAVKYQDQYGNDEVQSSTNLKFYFDDTTKDFTVDPTFSDTSNDDDVQVTYTLPEDASLVYAYIYDTSKIAGNRKLSSSQLSALISRLSASERSRALRSKLTIANTSTYYTGGEANTLNLDADDFINDSDVTSYNSTNNTLVSGTSYYVAIGYQDLASNAEVTSNNSGTDTYDYDSGTETPTMSSAAELADATAPLLRVSYNLPEAGTNETVKILVCNTNSSSDIHTTVTLEGHNDSGDSGDIDLTVPFTTSDSDVYAVSGTASLTDGNTYYVFVQYQDEAGNDAATSSSKSLTWDGATETPTLSLPTNGGSDNASLTVNITFPETPYTNTMKLYISDHTAKASMTLTLTGITSGSDFVLDGSDLSAANNSNISATSGLFDLVNGNQYDVYFGYRDDWGNAEAVSGTNTFTYDTSASAISVSSPANSTTVTGDFDIVYTKSETAKTGTFTIMFDNASDGNDATLTMNDTYCGYTDEQTITVDVSDLASTTGVSSVSGASSLVDGESYTVRFNYTDEAGNNAPESTITDLAYSTTSTVLTITKIAVDSGNPLDGDLSTWQPIVCYKGETNTNNATISSFKITKLGSNSSDDFETDAVSLWESTDATLDTSSDTNLGTKAFAADWTWDSGFGSIGSGSDDRYYFFCVDVTSGFNEAHTIGGRVGDGDVVSDADDTVNDPSGNLDSELKYLDGYISIAGGDYGDAVIDPGTDDNPFFTFHVKTNQGSITMSQVEIALSGSVVSGDFPAGAFQLYKDTDSDFAGATAIGSSLDFDATLTFSSLSQTITTTDTYYFLTCDVDANADGTHNITATLTASATNPTTDYANILDADAGDISGGTHTLPVELSSFNITNSGRKVILAWTTQSETDNQGFNIFRGITENDIANQQALKLNKLLIPGAINSTQPTDYMFYDDKRIEYGTTYYYWIQTVDLSGFTEFTDPVSYKPIAPTNSHDIPGLLTYGLHSNYPNPFNPETTISFILDKSSEITLDIYNIKGQKIRSLLHENAVSGKLYKVIWNGKNDQNRSVASGVYFYRLNTANRQYQKAMLLLK